MMPLTWSLDHGLTVGERLRGQRERGQLRQEVVGVVVKRHRNAIPFISSGQQCSRKCSRTWVPNVSASTGTRSSTPWNNAEKSRSGGSRNGTNPKHRIPNRANAFASVPPASMYGTVRASGSAARIAPFIASSNSPSKPVSYDGRSTIHSRETSGPMISSTSRSNAASRPGSTRQSTRPPPWRG